jgi:hypothetical protein
MVFLEGRPAKTRCSGGTYVEQVVQMMQNEGNVGRSFDYARRSARLLPKPAGACYCSGWCGCAYGLCAAMRLKRRESGRVRLPCKCFKVVLLQYAAFQAYTRRDTARRRYS